MLQAQNRFEKGLWEDRAVSSREYTRQWLWGKLAPRSQQAVTDIALSLIRDVRFSGGLVGSHIGPTVGGWPG